MCQRKFNGEFLNKEKVSLLTVNEKHGKIWEFYHRDNDPTYKELLQTKCYVIQVPVMRLKANQLSTVPVYKRDDILAAAI